MAVSPRHVGHHFVQIGADANTQTRGMRPIDIQRAAYGQDVMPLSVSTAPSTPTYKLGMPIGLTGVRSFLFHAMFR